MGFSNVHELEVTPIWDGVRARAIHGERTTLTWIELAPGAVVPAHSHDNEQMAILVDGSVRFRIGDETRDLSRGGTWSIPPNVEHEVTAGDAGATLVELFTPGRGDDWSSITPEAPARVAFLDR
jgi:quercetin dioxygenase-like cupin family protein